MAERSSRNLPSFSDFEIKKKIGRGRFGHVFEVCLKESNKKLAMKVLLKSELQEAGIGF